jgi:hypothetical protein
MGRWVMRIGCHRAREARRRAPSNLEFTSRPGFRKDPGLFVCPFISGPAIGPALGAPPRHTEVRCTSDRSLTSCREARVTLAHGASRTQADTGIRSRHLMAGVLRHNGRATPLESEEVAGMCAAGTPASCSESTLWRRSALASEHNRDEMTSPFKSPRRAHASRVEIGRNDWAAPEPVTGPFMPR